MLWRFSFASTSTLDSLLSRETPPSVEEVMDDAEVLSECKSQNNKLVNFLSREDSVKSLLQWVISDLEELDDQARRSETACLAKARKETDRYPTFSASSPKTNTSGLETDENSAPLEPAKIADQILTNATSESDETSGGSGGGGRSDAEQENIMGLLNRNAPAPSEEDVAQRARYPNIAAEILTSELWVIPETILSNKEGLLRPFWDAVIPPVQAPQSGFEYSREELYEISETARARQEFGTEEDDERDRRREVIRSLWVKVNGSLITKRTTEMVRFIQSIPDVIARLMAQVASPAISDITIRLVSSEEAGVFGVIQWLSEQGLISRLLPLLSPYQTPNAHTVASDVLKAIITLCAPPPFNPLGGNMQEQQSAQGATSGSRDNRMVREMVTAENVEKLVGFMLDPVDLTDLNWQGVNGDGSPNPADPFIIHPLPSLASASSSVSHICTLFIELIRRNNSDFAEPHLFHTLRNRLINMRMEAGAPLGQMEEGEKEDQDREQMEDAVKGMSEAMGIVYLRYMVEMLCKRFEDLNRLLQEARTQKRAASPLYPHPLTAERFRIVELLAELLHASNMSIFNRAPGTGPVYSDGILSGGLAGLEALGEAIDEDRDTSDEPPVEQVTTARELPVSSSASTDASLSGEDVGSEDEQMLEDIEEEDSTPGASPASSGILDRNESDPRTPRRKDSTAPSDADLPAPSPADVARLRDVMNMEPVSTEASEVGAASNAAIAATTAAPSVSSDVEAASSSPQITNPHTRDTSAAISSFPPGEQLKKIYLQYHVIPTLINLFFEYPSNDFLHHVVYDVLQQILNGRLTPGANRDLVVEIICGAKLVERVLEAQRQNDQIVAEGKRPRLGYMGHIILTAEDIVKFLHRCPSDLRSKIMAYIPQPEWDQFVAGQLQETRARDTQLLAGGKPMTTTTSGTETGEPRSEEESSSDSDDDSDDANSAKLGGFGTFGEPLQRTKATEGFVHRGGGEGSGDDEGSEEGDAADRYWRTGTGSSRRHVDSSDEDEDDADWLRPSDEFGGFQGAARSTQTHDEFDDDETWGVFSSAGASSTDQENENPFGDDNFAPTVSTRSAAAPVNADRPPPLTPHDWFDREFSDAWNDDEAAVPGIIMPADDDGKQTASPNAEKPTTPGRISTTPGSAWSFAADEAEAEESPNAISPEVDEGGFPSSDKPAAVDDDKDVESGIKELSIAEPDANTAPSSAPIPIPTSASKESASSPSSSPTESSPIHSSTSTTAPIPIRSPAATTASDSLASSSSPIQQSSSPRKSRPPPPPPVPRKRRQSSQSDSKPSVPHPPSDTSTGLGASPIAGSSALLAMGTRLSPSRASPISAATSTEEPLGPGVSSDVSVTRDGMLKREVDGKEVIVPQDEVVRGVEEAVEDEIRERRASQTE